MPGELQSDVTPSPRSAAGKLDNVDEGPAHGREVDKKHATLGKTKGNSSKLTV